ncbi:DNA-binding CsgD family transcriptional regulator/predicted DNA-binding transcriptional regulator [Allocatelliglobosispora scoriae]|uniref:DNA-binding CsgD family transcriptional regulator/predicted DNA-binding transcriptional regulator n=1 Tax=Allocatelliglobosispora scoriae TaxID=643052 RepID=A0A841C137_9ACTN|nr:helix-turn-helix transcriptional regulator [Allocatelliglobosispora scoriae]MBB5872680.1 DNA-binding CsgD family transcriptional regulator/predicted DNA-binding transcriptional regulator [Allocatelliglobosispora scoriae]
MITTAPPLLTRWGVSIHADLVYRTLTLQGSRSGGELTRSLELSARTVSAALDELHGLGIVALVADAKLAQGRVWRGHPPESAVRTLREQQHRLATARRELHRQLSVLDLVEITPAELREARPITTVDAARRRLGELMAAERHEHLAMNPEQAFTGATTKAAIPTAREVLLRGVATMTLGVPAAVEDESELHAVELDDYGLQYREQASQPIKLMIMDRTTAFLPLEPDSNFSRGVWEISSAQAVSRLVAFFLGRWHSAVEPLPRAAAPMPLSSRERAIITLLARGETDGSVATTLGLSVRTIAYTVRELMERNGVTTRFQLGLALGAEVLRAGDTSMPSDTTIRRSRP